MRIVSHMAKPPETVNGVPLIMHGAKLPADDVFKIGLIHAATRKPKRTLHAEAYALLFEKYEKLGVLQPSAAELAVRTLKGEDGKP
jgi:hypothetical protein